MKRTLLVAGIVVALVAGVFAAAAAGAQEGTPEPSPSADTEGGEDEQRPRDRFADLLAENLGISREEFDAAVKQTKLDLIDEALAEGRIDEEEAAEARERVENGEPVFPGFGPGHHPRPPFAHRLHFLMETAADLLGIEEDELRDRFGDGESLAEMAEAQGLDVEQFKTDLLAAVKASLDEKVADGDLEQERAASIYERFSENIDRLINAEHAMSLSVDGEAFEERFEMRIGDGEAGIAEAMPVLPFFDVLPLPEDEKAANSDA